MLFNSLDFAIFVAIVFVLYWFVFNKSLWLQNLLILVASYIFYGWWDWRFLILIATSSVIDFLVGYSLDKTEVPYKRKLLLYTSLFVNLSLLGFFKYFNFFIDSFKTALQIVDMPNSISTLDIILPVAISFYTLQTLSYTIDVYDKKMKATHNIVNFFAFVSFFPQLVAGPIERAYRLLPQFDVKRKFEYSLASDGARQILWGLFKKMMIADHLILFSVDSYNNYGNYSGATLMVIVILGSFIFYCDFSGYSDIAIGTARLFGFRLSKNFDFPFFARNMSEFWNKWHISLISWFKDYIISRLKGFSKAKLARNVFIIFLVTGIWHGAGMNYIIWGLLHALLFLPLIFGKRKKYKNTVGFGKSIPSWNELIRMLLVLFQFSFIGIWFLSSSSKDGFLFVKHMFSMSLFEMPVFPPIEAIISMTILIIVEWMQRNKEHGLDFTNLKLSLLKRYAIYFGLIFLILFFGASPQDFTYFQF